ncbi:two-component regulator propeller domain-containing protein [Azotosporobacter soli]|uniref:two-component regulator propeller domain-containing protein n=1 Tax=Azotosporobacter soli TaxID=3055040 RepID=UPI0031FF2004
MKTVFLKRCSIFLSFFFFFFLYATDKVFMQPASSLSESYISETLSSREGLSQNWITCLLKDRLSGLMWFGTLDGLYVYDAYSFHIYKYDRMTQTSLPRDAILSLHQDRNGTIWVGTSGGLARFNRITDNFTVWRHDPLDPSSLSNDAISVIYDDTQGNLWFGSQDGLNLMQPSSNQFIRFLHASDNLSTLSNNHITTIFQDSSGFLWIGTEDGLNLFHPDSSTFERYTAEYSRLLSASERKKVYSGLPQPHITALTEDRAGRLWLGTNRGLIEYQRAARLFVQYNQDSEQSGNLSSEMITALLPAADGRLRLATEGGLIFFDPKEELFRTIQEAAQSTNSRSNNYIAAMLEDDRQILWLATHGNGIEKIRQNPFVWYGRSASPAFQLSDNHVRSILTAPDGTLWIGTQNGLNHIDQAKNLVHSFFHQQGNASSLPHSQVNAIAQDSRGTLWFGTPAGLSRLQSDGAFATLLHDPSVYNTLTHNNISTLYPDPSGKLWIGTMGGGLTLYDPASGLFTPYRYNLHDPNSLSNNYVQSLTLDRRGILWVGTSDGLNRFDRSREEFIRYKHDYRDPNSLSNSNITAIHEDKLGNLWIATWGGGLNRYDPAKDGFIAYQQKDGLSSNILLGLLEDQQGDLWLSSDRGLTKFDPANNTYHIFTVSDGLQGNEFNLGAYRQSQNGDLYFGGQNGLNRFSPETILEKKFTPKVILTRFKVFDHEIPLALSSTDPVKIHLSYKDNYFSLEYAAIDYMSPEKIKYAYRLDGFDSDWVDAGTRRFASYTNLDGGSYTFRVKATDSDGVWTEEELKLQIFISTPPWKSWWAYSCYLLFSGSIIWLLMRYSSLRSAQKVEARSSAEIRKLWQAIEQSEHAILISDIHGKIEYVNHNFCQVSGYDLMQLKGELASRLQDLNIQGSTSFEKLWRPFWSLLNPPNEQRRELFLQRQNGLSYWGLIVISPIRNSLGETLSFLLTMGDITDLKSAEQKLSDTNEELSQTLAELRNTQTELLRQEKMAALGELVAGVAHEINTPVGVGITAVSFLSQQAEDFFRLFQTTALRKSDVEKFIETCQESSQIIHLNLVRAAELVKSFKQVAVDQTSEQERDFNLDEYLHSILLSLHPALKKTKITVTVDCPPALHLYSYPGVFSQIITNLISNSLLHAYQPDDSGTITLNVTADEVAHLLTLSYQDDGRGMTSEVLKRIFDPFFTTKRTSGTGLGMHIVHNLVVQKLHGRIDVSSHENKGFRCVIQIPLPPSDTQSR